MGLASGSASFQRYFLSESAPADVTDAFVQAVNDNAFGRYGAASADGIEVGWISPRHLFASDIAADQIAAGRFVSLAMRLDRNNVPPAIMKSYIRIEEETALEASGREFLSKAERTQAREAARLRADREAKSGAFRRIAAYPLLMDLDRKIVYFGNLAAGANDKMVCLFQDTFDCALEPATAERLAYRLLQADPDGIEHARPFTLVPAPEGYDGAPDDFDTGDRSFLGKEFLTWLWFAIDSNDATLRVSTGDEVTVMIDRTMRLECDFSMTGTDVITADGPSALPEAKAALATGKQPTKLGLIFGGRAGEFYAVLDGKRMAVSGMVLPPDEDDDPATRRERRFEQIADAAELLDVLYELFLRRRTSGRWSQELGRMRAWAAAKPPAATAASA